MSLHEAFNCNKDVIVILVDPPCKYKNVRFTTVPLKALFDRV